MRTFNKVLLIDDDEINNMLNANIIRKVGITDHIDAVLNGQDAVEYLESCSKDDFPDLVFLDIHMPIMDGFEFLEVFKTRFQPLHDTIILMMLTTSVLEADRERALSGHIVHEFISKPLTSEKLEAIMENLEKAS